MTDHPAPTYCTCETFQRALVSTLLYPPEMNTTRCLTCGLPAQPPPDPVSPVLVAETNSWDYVAPAETPRQEPPPHADANPGDILFLLEWYQDAGEWGFAGEVVTVVSPSLDDSVQVEYQGGHLGAAPRTMLYETAKLAQAAADWRNLHCRT